MDTVTHLVAGALTPLAFRNAPKRTALVWFGILAGELPDIDVIFGGSPQALLTLHRGITHAVYWQPVMALLLVLPFYIRLCRPQKNAVFHGPQGQSPLSAGARDAFSRPGVGLGTLFVMAFFALFTHLYLDCMTTFGTMILLPFSEARVAMPAMFIVDLLLTVPAGALLILALLQKPEEAHGPAPSWAIAGRLMVSARARRLARIGLAWILIYPLCGLAVNTVATSVMAPRLAQTPGSKLTLLTEPFSPFVWKAVVDEGDHYRMGTLFLFSPNSIRWSTFAKPDASLKAELMQTLPIFRDFAGFCPTLVDIPRPAEGRVTAFHSQPVTEHALVDLRYIISEDSPARFFGRKDPNFVLEVRARDQGGALAYRFLNRGRQADAAWLPVR